GYVNLSVFDSKGSLVAELLSSEISAGNYDVDFEGSELTSGVYFYKLSTEGFTDTKKMILVR
ncbi:MAG: T9SS type A sorting domain-containing protein, partial [Ignavibacteria bacterium]|nr:T9SS type A sorting domain-containing protein [Ignavibacteria bacterium]